MYSGHRVINIEKANSSPKIIPERLKEARIYRGLTQQELAKEVGLTKQAICNYEIDAKTPSMDILINISKILRFPINFFYKQRIICSENGEVYFRSSVIPAKKKETLEQKLNYIATEVIYFIENYINLPEVNLIDIPYKKEYSNEDIKEIVSKIRKHWGLNNEPIKNLTYIMQENGCIIARVSLDSEKTDGYSKWMWNRPYTLLNEEKNAAARMRFTLAHELGHIVLHRNLKNGEDLKRREKEANFFAGEFLFPSEAVINEISMVSLNALLPIKAKWRISIGAIVRRCSDLELITDERYTLLQKQISKRKWRFNEPLDDTLEVEEPKLFNEAFNLLIDNGIIIKSDIANSILFSEDELINICCLNPDFFAENKISLKPKLEIVK
jgi:Predicted Zn peptidase